MKKRRTAQRSATAHITKQQPSVAEETVTLIPNRASDPIASRREWLVVLFLVVAVLIPYGQVLGFDFVNYDDELYVTGNTQVQQGLNAETLTWAFTTTAAYYFHPLTWMSHMLDCQMYGLNAGGHHFTSLLIHIIDTVLLFWVLRRMTGLLWASAFTAALFGVHPLHVESVAWVAERKDVLSALFWIAGMGAYARFVRVRSLLSYGLLVLMFVLALMSKPMAVTFPCVLLLLDYWPLNRFGDRKPGKEWLIRATRLAIEKVPLFALCAASAASTLVMQHAGGNLSQGNAVPFHDRLANAFVAYAVYIGKTMVPFHLAPFYPHPGARPLWQTGLALLVLVAITLPVAAAWRKRPYLIVGWLWFIGTLVPVIELVQAGDFAYADRYTYIPSIGLSVMVFYGVTDLVQSRRLQNKVFVSAGTAWVIGLMICSVFQVHLWRDSFSLFTHALRVTPASYLAHNNLGLALLDRGDLDEAKAHFLKALEAKPNYTKAHNNLSRILLDQGNVDEARLRLMKALELNPNSVKGHYGLGSVLVKQGRFDEARDHFRKALELKPDYVDAHNSLGALLVNQKLPDEARIHFLKAIELQPDSAEAYRGLGAVLMIQGRPDEAKAHLLKALALKPDFVDAHVGLGRLFQAQGNLDEAKAHFLSAAELAPNSVDAHNDLGSILVNQKVFDEAQVHFQKALEIDPRSAQAYQGLGAILVNQGHLEEGKADLLKAVELKPDFVEAHINLGIVLKYQGRADEAKAHFRKALEIDPNSSDARTNLNAMP